ncbi:ABC transporter permease [Xylanimonas sp. McL0601]|uniref:ABC transporter permease n=1 Tax=Xylanimonas sp. McL0601 TaxID=3414739 RepID=UPI003CE77FD5
MPDAPFNDIPAEDIPADASVVTATRPGQGHFFADLDQTPVLGAVDAPNEESAPASLWKDAWIQMRGRVLFWISAALMVLVILVAVFPQWFSNVDPRFCDLSRSLGDPAPGHWFGFDFQGCDVYSRVIYGARASVTVGVLTTIGVTVLGVIVGAIAGYNGGWLDSVLSRITDIFFAIPLLLAAILVASVFSQSRTVFLISGVLAVFGWPQIARIMRGAVFSVKNNEFIIAARALGISSPRLVVRHVIPNSIAPVIATATVALGTFIVVEATLSFLGVGLPPSVVSWGGDISRAQQSIRTAPQLILYPGAALGLTVLSFIMMGDVVRDALDPKARTR